MSLEQSPILDLLLPEGPIGSMRVWGCLNAALAVFAPLARSGKRSTAWISSVLGILMAVWSAVGVFVVSDREVEMAPGVPAIAGPGVAALLGTLIAAFGRKAYNRE